MRAPALAAALLTLVAVQAACGGDPGSAGGGPAPARSPVPGLQASVAATQLTPGARRLPIGVMDHGAPVNDATVRIGLSFASQPLGEADAPFQGGGLEGRGLYVAHVSLPVAGLWMATIAIRRPSGETATVAAPFRVTPTTDVPAVGQPAPRSHNLTASDVRDVADIDSGSPPDDMHQLSIAQAIEQHRPALVVFATPAFCQSATCGPEIHAIQQLEPAYRDRMAFIHVEVYEDFRPDPSRRRLAPAMQEWHLQTEPWIFLVDRSGVINAEFEAATGTEELRPALDALLAA